MQAELHSTGISKYPNESPLITIAAIIVILNHYLNYCYHPPLMHRIYFVKAPHVGALTMNCGYYYEWRELHLE